MYGESPDITGGMGGEGVDAFAKFLDGGGTLIAMGNAVRFPTEFGLARTVDASGTHLDELLRAAAARQRRDAAARSSGVLRLHGQDHADQVPRRAADVASAQPDQASVLARYVGGDAAVLSGLMRGADEIRQPAVRHRRAGRIHRQGTRRPVREQSDLSLAEPRRVQHGVQLHAELERHGRRGAAGHAHTVATDGSSSPRRARKPSDCARTPAGDGRPPRNPGSDTA